MSGDDDTPDLGPCCVCERVGPQVRNVMMIDRRGPAPGKGWGCVVCGLPSDGAVAVVCDDCTGLDLRFVCAGYISERGRIPCAELARGRVHPRSSQARRRRAGLRRMTEQQKTVTDELHAALGALSVAHQHVAPIGPGLVEPIDVAIEAIDRALKSIQHMRCDTVAALDKL